GSGQSSDSVGLTITIDTVAPAAPASAPVLQVASDSGSSSVDGITNDTTPTFDIVTGSDYYRVFRSGTLISSNYELSSTFTPGALSNGSYDIGVAYADPAGNSSAVGPTKAITIDTVAPTVGIPDLQAASDSGVSSTDNITNNNTPNFNVTVNE